MNTFVNDIKTSASRGKVSMENTIKSTLDMSLRIDDVDKTINDNVGKLNASIIKIKDITSSINEIKIAANEINDAMDATGKDAERLSDMTRTIHSNSLEAKEIADKFRLVDNRLASLNRATIDSLKNTSNSLTNKDTITILKQTKVSHTKWLEKLKQMVESMKVLPLQTDDHKCGFGHYYHSIEITYPTIEENWKLIDKSHHLLHNNGKATIEAIKNSEMDPQKGPFFISLKNTAETNYQIHLPKQ